MSKRQIFWWLVIFALTFLIANLYNRKPDQVLTGQAQVIDGDSIRLAGEDMRLQGIDAPEYLQICENSGKPYACGKESAAALRKIMARGVPTCVGSVRDRYHRLLVICRILGQDVNAEMVKSGMAISFDGTLYAAEETFARDDMRGIWAGTFQHPAEYRKANPRGAPAAGQ